MNKYLKGCLIILGILLLIVSIIAGFFYYQISTSRERSVADNLDCSNGKYIVNQPTIEISDSVMTRSVRNIKVYLIQNSKKVDSMEIANNFEDRIQFNFPFEKAPLSSKTLIKTENHEFLLLNMKYYNDEKWGMFGYLGKDCQFLYEYKILK